MSTSKEPKFRIGTKFVINDSEAVCLQISNRVLEQFDQTKQPPFYCLHFSNDIVWYSEKELLYYINK